MFHSTSPSATSVRLQNTRLMHRKCIRVVSFMRWDKAIPGLASFADPGGPKTNPREAPSRVTRPQKSFKHPMAICGSNQTPTLTPIYSIYLTIHVGPGCHKRFNGADESTLAHEHPQHTPSCAHGGLEFSGLWALWARAMRCQM